MQPDSKVSQAPLVAAPLVLQARKESQALQALQVLLDLQARQVAVLLVQPGHRDHKDSLAHKDPPDHQRPQDHKDPPDHKDPQVQLDQWQVLTLRSYSTMPV